MTTPGFRLIATPATVRFSGRPTSSRTRLGKLRNGQALADQRAHAMWQGGSALVRLMPHIGPARKAKSFSRIGRPQTQQRRSRMDSLCLRPSATLKSGSPSLSARRSTNQGIGYWRASTGKRPMPKGI